MPLPALAAPSRLSAPPSLPVLLPLPPQAFTSDFRVHWAQHPLRPEFAESTYFLFKVSVPVRMPACRTHASLPYAWGRGVCISDGSLSLTPQATRDPYYLEVGRTVLENLNRFARVPCGFAAMKDVRTGSHEDR